MVNHCNTRIRYWEFEGSSASAPSTEIGGGRFGRSGRSGALPDPFANPKTDLRRTGVGLPHRNQSDKQAGRIPGNPGHPALFFPSARLKFPETKKAEL